MQRALTDWEGDFEELLSWEDEPLANPKVCETLFASKPDGAFADDLSYDIYSDETFEQVKARVHEWIDEMGEDEYDRLRHRAWALS